MLAIPGWAVALYHTILYFSVNFGQKAADDFVVPCTTGPNTGCATRYIEWLGFITIPSLALIAFSVIIVTLSISLWATHKNTITN
jgi:disulfide bond formation protein DsbB